MTVKLLIFDVLFPTQLGQWRTTEINYFLDHPDFSTDIYISSYVNINGINIKQSFEEYYKNYNSLNGYNIIIFDPAYNFLNVFNKNFDGTKFNRQSHGSFLLTKDANVDWKKYDVAYSIFLIVRETNSWLIDLKYWPSLCKIYPGGGFMYNENRMRGILTKIHQNNESVICSHHFIREVIDKYNIKNSYTIYGGPLLEENANLVRTYESAQKGKLNVCFTSFSFAPGKGWPLYVQLFKFFKGKFPSHDITFHVIGPISAGTFSNHKTIFHGFLSPQSMRKIYTEKIDIIVSPLQGNVYESPNGFPIGGEAMICGCIPIMCDPHDSNPYFGFDDTDSLIMKTFDLDRIVKFILELYDNVDKRVQMSKNILQKSQRLLGTEIQLKPVENIIKSLVKT